MQILKLASLFRQKKGFIKIVLDLSNNSLGDSDLKHLLIELYSQIETLKSIELNLSG